MGFQLSVPLLCFAVLAVMQCGGQAHEERRMFSYFQQMLQITEQKVGDIGDKHRRDMETLNSGLNSRIEERVKHLFRKWAGMPEIPIYCPYPVLSDKLLETSCKGVYTEGMACELKCPMAIHLIGPRIIRCTRPASGYTGYWDAGDGEPRCKKATCPPLRAPNNGALVCDKWSGGMICQIHCREGYDIQDNIITLVYICSSNGVWIEQHVPDCTYREHGERSRMPENYYFTGQCHLAHPEVKKSFLDYAEARHMCPIRAHCTVENVEIKCGDEDEDEYDDWID
ncbi:uncharacterized protein [Haliotis cracherodii]|uniref:uncharacterized protein n=1 Tax=Haliotis cracherodii TaxID=6455 RepID=UPI0039EA883C